MVKAWVIPKGISYTNFFLLTDEGEKKILGGWPMLTDKRSGHPQTMCVKHQCLGKCRVKCNKLHFDPKEIDHGVVIKNGNKFKNIYSNPVQ